MNRERNEVVAAFNSKYEIFCEKWKRRHFEIHRVACLVIAVRPEYFKVSSLEFSFD